MINDDRWTFGEGGRIVQKNFGVRVGQSTTGPESYVVFKKYGSKKNQDHLGNDNL